MNAEELRSLSLILLVACVASAAAVPDPPAVRLAGLPPLPPALTNRFSKIRPGLVTDTNQPGVSVRVNSAGSASLPFVWEPVTNALPPIFGYRVYYSTNSGSYDASQRQEVGGAGASSLTVTGLLYSTHYWFVAVSVADFDTESTYSQEVDWITDGPPRTNWAYMVWLQGGPTPAGPWTNTDASISWTGLSTDPSIYFRAFVNRTNP